VSFIFRATSAFSAIVVNGDTRYPNSSIFLRNFHFRRSITRTICVGGIIINEPDEIYGNDNTRLKSVRRTKRRRRRPVLGGIFVVTISRRGRETAIFGFRLRDEPLIREITQSWTWNVRRNPVKIGSVDFDYSIDLSLIYYQGTYSYVYVCYHYK